MWDAVDPEVGKRREEQLKSEERLFKTALDGGAKMLQYRGTKDSARTIVKSLLHGDPVPLLVQQELVDQHKSVADTTVGAALIEELSADQRGYDEPPQASLALAIERAVNPQRFNPPVVLSDTLSPAKAGQRDCKPKYIAKSLRGTSWRAHRRKGE